MEILSSSEDGSLDGGRQGIKWTKKFNRMNLNSKNCVGSVTGALLSYVAKDLNFVDIRLFLFFDSYTKV